MGNLINHFNGLHDPEKSSTTEADNELRAFKKAAPIITNIAQSVIRAATSLTPNESTATYTPNLLLVSKAARTLKDWIKSHIGQSDKHR